MIIVAGLGILFSYTNIKGSESNSNKPETLDEQNIMDTDENKNTVILRTNMGDIELVLFRDKAPNTSENFEELAKIGFYDGTRFHRVIKNFMIQGGDPQSKDVTLKSAWGTGGPGYQFADEMNNEKVVRGALAMANSGPNTNGSQFFIVTTETASWLDGKHTVFGKVVDGMDTVDAIESVATDTNDVPVEDVIIESVEIR